MVRWERCLGRPMLRHPFLLRYQLAIDRYSRIEFNLGHGKGVEKGINREGRGRGGGGGGGGGGQASQECMERKRERGKESKDGPNTPFYSKPGLPGCC